jgi:hypothetical protein
MVVYLLARSRLDRRDRVVALILAVAPTAVVNTQPISGFRAPNNLEQSFGVIALAAVSVLAMKTAGERPWMLLPAAAGSLLAARDLLVAGVRASTRRSCSAFPLDAIARRHED